MIDVKAAMQKLRYDVTNVLSTALLIGPLIALHTLRSWLRLFEIRAHRCSEYPCGFVYGLI